MNSKSASVKCEISVLCITYMDDRSLFCLMQAIASGQTHCSHIQKDDAIHHIFNTWVGLAICNLNVRSLPIILPVPKQSVMLLYIANCYLLSFIFSIINTLVCSSNSFYPKKLTLHSKYTSFFSPGNQTQWHVCYWFPALLLKLMDHFKYCTW